MQRLYLTKDFSELDGLELCVVHWTVTRIGLEPDWRKARTVALQSATGPVGVREAVLEIGLEGDGPWTLHHFFEFVRYGAWQSSPRYFEDIGTLPIEYLDRSGEFTHATLLYNVGQHGWTNLASMTLEGAPAQPASAPEWPDEPGHALGEQKVRFCADRMSLPLRFYGTIAAPVGAQVFYSIHLARRSGLNPMADSGRWIARREIVV